MKPSLAYKIGQMKILELRAAAREALGARFEDRNLRVSRRTSWPANPA